MGRWQGVGALDGQRYLSGISHCLGPSFLAPYITPPSERGRFDRRVKHACSPVRCPRSRQVRPRVAGPWALAPLPLPQHADPLSIAPGTFSGVGSHHWRRLPQSAAAAVPGATVCGLAGVGGHQTPLGCSYRRGCNRMERAKEGRLGLRWPVAAGAL